MDLAGAKVNSPKPKSLKKRSVFVARKPPTDFNLARVTARLSKKPSPRNPRQNARNSMKRNQNTYMSKLSRNQQLDAMQKRVNKLLKKIKAGELRR